MAFQVTYIKTEEKWTEVTSLPYSQYWMGLDNFLFVTPAVALEYMLCNEFLLKPSYGGHLP